MLIAICFFCACYLGSASPVSSSWFRFRFVLFRFRFVLVPDAYRDLLFLRLLSGARLSQKVEKATLNLTFSRRVSGGLGPFLRLGSGFEDADAYRYLLFLRLLSGICLQKTLKFRHFSASPKTRKRSRVKLLMFSWLLAFEFWQFFGRSRPEGFGSEKFRHFGIVILCFVILGFVILVEKVILN